jgi:hypothetical protein
VAGGVVQPEGKEIKIKSMIKSKRIGVFMLD